MRIYSIIPLHIGIDMETENQGHNSKNENPLDLIKFDLNEDEIDLNEINLDDLSFKPINKGLGFHHETKRSTLNKRPTKSTNFNQVTNNLEKATFKKRSSNSLNGPMIESSEVSEFYKRMDNEDRNQTPQTEQIEPALGKTKKIVFHKDATLSQRFGAFIIDIIILSGFMGIIFSGLIKFVNREYDIFKILSSLNYISLLGIILFGVLFIAYFSIIELFTTPGKVLLNIEVIRADGKKLGIRDTISRAVVSFLSVLLFCMPLFLKFQDRLSETRVVRK